MIALPQRGNMGRTERPKFSASFATKACFCSSFLAFFASFRLLEPVILKQKPQKNKFVEIGVASVGGAQGGMSFERSRRPRAPRWALWSSTAEQLYKSPVRQDSPSILISAPKPVSKTLFQGRFEVQGIKYKRKPVSFGSQREKTPS